jgi:hypothetical protein
VDSNGEIVADLTGYDFIYAYMFSLNPFNSKASYPLGNYTTANINHDKIRTVLRGLKSAGMIVGHNNVANDVNTYQYLLNKNIIKVNGGTVTLYNVNYSNTGSSINFNSVAADTAHPIIEATQNSVKYYTTQAMTADCFTFLYPLAKHFLCKDESANFTSFNNSYDEDDFRFSPLDN